MNQKLSPDFNVRYLRTKPNIIQSGMGSLYFYLPDYYGNLLFYFNKSNDQFISTAEQFPEDRVPSGLFQDDANNICFLFRNPEGAYRAILEDTLGIRYDYSPVLAWQQTINHIQSRNFFANLFVVGTEGLIHIEINSVNGVHTAMTGDWISSMMDLNDTTLLVNTIGGGWKRLNTRSLIENGQGIHFYHCSQRR